MNNRIMQEVLADFEARRQQNEQEEARRQRDIEARFPDLAALVLKRHEMIMQSVRSGLSGCQENPEEKMAEYNRAIAGALRAAGLPEDYLNPVCQCPICRDSGYVYDARGLQKPCACLLEAYRQRLAGSERREDGPSFEAFDLSRFPQEPLPGTDVTQREYMSLVKEKCLRWAENVPQGPVKTLLLHGGSGLGKTYLLRCVEKHAAERGIDAVCTTAFDLLSDLRSAFFSREKNEAAAYFDADLLLIDDLGMEPLMENITVEQIYNLLNARLTRGKYTAVSTNLSRTELQAKYTERVSSRLLDTRAGLAIPFLGKDIRQIKP